MFSDPLSGDFLPYSSPAQYPMGLPGDQQDNNPPPGFQSTLASISPPPPISTAEKLWNSLKQNSQSALQWTESEVGDLYAGGKNVVSSVYHDVSEGVGTVVSDVTAPARITYWYILLAVVVVAGGLYYVGKGGAVKVSV